MNTISLFRLAIIGAVLVGLGCSIFFILVMQIINISPLARYIDLWIPAWVMFFFMRRVRQQRQGQAFHFWEGIYMGNIIGILGGMISGLFLYLYINFISAQPLDNYKNASLVYLENSKKYVVEHMGQEEYMNKKNQIETFSAWGLAKDESIRKIFYCFVLVPVISMVNRKKI